LPHVIGRITSTAQDTGTTVEQPPETASSPDRYLREKLLRDSVNPMPGALQRAIPAYGLDRV
jgi:hypothetical protein